MSFARGGTPQDDASLVGRTVGRYRIDASIGRGGMGEVFLGWDARLEKSVAVKALRRDLVEDPRSRERFVREARYACRVQHPFVCSVLDVVEDREEIFLVMEHVEGLRLDDVISLERPTVDRVRDLAIEIAEALGAIHGAGLVHRDLKPSNVMVTADGHVKVMDFGVARLSAPLRSPDGSDATMTETGFGVGTVAYMSPEQIQGKKADARSDLFSLGIVLYQAITGEHPFERGSPYATASAILHDPPGGGREPATLSTAGATRQIVMRLLEKDPALRYPSAEAVIEDLRAAREGLRLAPVPKPRRVGAATVWTAAALVVAAGVTGYSWWRWGRLKPSQVPPSIAVLPFEDRSRNEFSDVRGASVAELLSAALTESGALRRLAPERIDELLRDAHPSVAPSDRVRVVRDASHADWIVTGTLHEAAQPGIEAVLEIHGSGSDAPRTLRIASAGLSGFVDASTARLLPLLAGDASPRPPPSPPIDESVALLVHRGRQAMRELRYADAISTLESATKADPRYVSAWTAYVEALAAAGYGSRTVEAAERLARLVTDSGGTDATRRRLEAQAVAAGVLGRSGDRVAALDRLEAAYPYDPEVLDRVARSALDDGRLEAALAALDRSLAIDGDDLAARLLRARTLRLMRRPEDAASELAAAGSLAERGGRPAALAAVAIERGHQFRGRGEAAAAAEAYRDCARRYDSAGLPQLGDRCRGNLADLEISSGRVADAASLLTPSISAARRDGRLKSAAEDLTALGAAYHVGGRLKEAESCLREAVEIGRRLDNDAVRLQATTNLASVVNYAGRFSEAVGLADEAIELSRRRSNPEMENTARFVRCDASFSSGALEDAARCYGELLAVPADTSGSAEIVAWAELGRSEVAACRGLLGEAWEAAELGTKGDAPEGAVRRLYGALRKAEVATTFGSTEEARSDLDAAEKAAGDSLPDLAARSALGRAATYVLDGRLDRAAPLAADAERIGRTGGAQGLALPAAGIRAEIALRSGRAGEAVRVARSIVEAPEARFIDRLRGRLTLAEALAASGEGDAARIVARTALGEARNAGMPFEIARASALVVSLPAADSSPDVESIRREGRAALDAVAAACPPDRRKSLLTRTDWSRWASTLGWNAGRG